MDITSTPLSTYGADEAGLICGFLFEPGQAAVELGSAQAAQWLATDSHSANSFLWLHFNLGHNGTQPWLHQHARLGDSFFEALNDGMHSTRIERDEDALVAVINDVHFDFSFEPSDISTLWINVADRLVLTARARPLRAVDHLRAAIKSGEPLGSPVALLERLLRHQADVLVGIVRSVTARVDDIEDELLAGRLNHKRVRLGALRRLLVRLQRLLAPEPAALLRLLQHPPGWTDESDLQELRAASEEFSVVLRDMASLQERIKLLQEEIAAEVNENNSKSLFVLTIVTVLALPINIIAGLMGMNVGGVPLAQHEHGFWIVVGVVATVTAVAGRWAFRARRDD
ncbi:transporter [Sphaerotilaceae bacterium SBD11-9]